MGKKIDHSACLLKRQNCFTQFHLFVCPFQFYVPEVLGVEEVEDELDAIAKAEFEKLEKKLKEKRLEEEKTSSDQ